MYTSGTYRVIHVPQSTTQSKVPHVSIAESTTSLSYYLLYQSNQAPCGPPASPPNISYIPNP